MALSQAARKSETGALGLRGFLLSAFHISSEVNSRLRHRPPDCSDGECPACRKAAIRADHRAAAGPHTGRGGAGAARSRHCRALTGPTVTQRPGSPGRHWASTVADNLLPGRFQCRIIGRRDSSMVADPGPAARRAGGRCPVAGTRTGGTGVHWTTVIPGDRPGGKFPARMN
eukprot:753098-Hanusia_phi.AAC.3